ncbi:MAG: DUF4912 domain-containing protein [Acidobacteriota bacterium]|nr:DUF4912 domain-containing protein [Acidobacteriota bacterium]
MPFFFDLTSLVPVVERNPFEPPVVPDVPVAEPLGEDEATTVDESVLTLPAAEPPVEEAEAVADELVVDRGLPIPEHYDFDMMRALWQDPFRLFVYWQLKDNPFDRLRQIFPAHEVSNFHSVLKLVDETTNISSFFNAAFTREYWFSVFPDRRYRVEFGVRSPRYGYIKLLSSQAAQTPRGGPSDQAATEDDYFIASDEFIDVLRDSHLVSERAFTIEDLLPGADTAPAAARNAMWDSLPASFRRLVMAIADIQAGRDYERWWERLSREEQGKLVQEFLEIIAQMAGKTGDGELGYMLLLRYLPELLRRSILTEATSGDGHRSQTELTIDKPISLYLAEQLGQIASEFNSKSSSDNAPISPTPGAQPEPSAADRWLPSLSV